MTTTIEVGLGTQRYPITIGRDLLEDAATWRTAIRGRHVLVVSDSNVAPVYAKPLQEVLLRALLPPGGAAAGRARSAGVAVLTSHDARSGKVQGLVLPAGEAHKNLATAARVFDALAELGATRDACIVALGGGVVGDIAGFAAACWMRGVDCVQVPTTLLAMVDASVGGKTGVDHPAGKNLIGAFHQPRAVVADLATLATLPDRELRAGLAEVIKTACIGDADFFAWLEGHVDALLARDPDALLHAVATCCRFKAGVVERDEREAGERALLNFGHTFGHALEAETGYATLLHGEAVAIGMLLAARLSENLGMASVAEVRRLQALVAACGLPTTAPRGLDANALLARMRLDKKNRAGALRLILWRGIGHAEPVGNVDEGQVRGVLAS